MSMPAEFLDAGAGSTLPSPQTPTSTRLYPPRVRANLVGRSSLISRLSEDPDRQLTLICAPAGFGKTTLAGQWVAHLALPTAWVRLEEGDNDPETFFALVLAALRLIDRDLGANTASRLTEPGLQPDAIIHQLIDDLSVVTRSFVLVLDDYHVIEESALHQAIDLLMQHLPAALRLVLISRSVPPLRLARLQASGDALVVTQSDLQFTAEETLQYLHSLDLDLAPSEVRLLHERTEGWVIGLQMVGSALRGRTRDQMEQFIRDFVGSVDLGDRYLWEEVLERQPEEVRLFLLHTSILDRFSASLCDDVSLAGNGDEMIRRCERDNLFILPLVGQGAWYRFHHLFADALREQLGRTATEGEIGDLHRRAAQWLEANGYFEDAIRHATAARDWPHAVAMLEVVCAELFEHDHISTLRTWLQGMTADILATSPQLAFWLAWSHGRTGRWSGGSASLRIAEEAWTASGDRLGEALVLLWHAGRFLWDRNNRPAIDYAQRSFDSLPSDRPFERILALMTLGIAHLNHGEPDVAQAVFSDVRTLIDTSSRSWLRPFEMTYSATVLMQQGRLLEASMLYRQVIRAAGDQPKEIGRKRRNITLDASSWSGVSSTMRDTRSSEPIRNPR